MTSETVTFLINYYISISSDRVERNITTGWAIAEFYRVKTRCSVHTAHGWPPRITYTERSKQHVELRGSKTIKVPNRSFGFCTAAEKYLSSSIFFVFFFRCAKIRSRFDKFICWNRYKLCGTRNSIQLEDA